MSGVSVDHVVSVIVLLAAIVLFIGLFDQTISVAVNYQHNTSTATQCDDLLDEILLTSAPSTSGSPTWFGLQASTLPSYNLDPFFAMRLDSSAGTPISYQKTGQTYSEIKTNPNNYLLYPTSDAVSYSEALTLLGLKNAYGFQILLTPTVNVSVTEISTNPLTLSVSAKGIGFPLANAQVNYLLIPISLNSNYPEFESTSNQIGSTQTGSTGTTPQITFSNLGSNPTFVFFAWAYLDGITGIGYYVSSSTGSQSIVPFVNPLSTLSVTLANSNDVPQTSATASALYYNSTFIFESDNYAFEQASMGNSNGIVTSGPGNLPGSISMSGYTPGIILVAYKSADDSNSGVALVPWGFSSLGFSLTFGESPVSQPWISTDMRQVVINGVSYQATLSLWSTQSYSEAI